MVNCGVEDFAWSLPSAVEVASSQGTSVVAVNDSVWIEHGNYFEHEVLS